MTSKRVPLALILCTVLFVTSGSAATKKFDRHRLASEEWNDSPLMSATLLSTGSSVPSDSGSASLSLGSIETGAPLVLGYPMNNTDSWNGGTDNWNSANNSSNWSTGSPPAPADDVTIYSNGSKGNDLVTLNVSPTISSLTLGGPINGITSELTDGGTAQTLTITKGLTVGQTGALYLAGGSTVTVGGDVTVMPANPKKPGAIDLENGSTLTVNGNVNNSRDIYTSFYGSGGNTITILGTLTNDSGGRFDVHGNHDVANVGMIANSGLVYVGTGGTLNLTNQPNGVTDVIAGSTWSIYGNFAVAGAANTGFANLNTVEEKGALYLGNKQLTSITPGGGLLTVGSTGRIEADYLGTKVEINGNVNNSGTISTSDDCCGGVTLTITGTLTNNPGGVLRVGFLAHMAGVDTVNVGMLANNGTVDVFSGSTLNLTNQLDVITDIAAGSTFDIAGTFHDVVNNADALANLTNLYGTVILENGQNTKFTPYNDTVVHVQSGGTLELNNGTTLTTGQFENFGTINVNGGSTFATTDLTNQNGGSITTGSDFTGGNKISSFITYNYGSWVLNGANDSVDMQSLDENSGSIVLQGANAKATIGFIGSNTGTIDVENGSTLTVNGNVTNFGLLASDYYLEGGGGTINITGNLTNSGTFWLADFTSAKTTGDVTNSGDFELLASTATIGGNLTNQNSGTVTMDGGILQVNGDLTNSGTLAPGCECLGPSSIKVNGLLTNTATGQITLDGSVLTALGGLTNKGMINVNNGSSIDPPFLKNGGTINIDSLSKFVVGTGNPMGLGYIQLANGTLTEIINGSTSTFGVINVNGSALLDGVLAILLEGSTPAEGSIYKFLIASPGQLSGMFAIGPDPELWEVTYHHNADGQDYVEAEFIPEPATLLVLIPGLLGVGYGLRRRTLQ